MKKPIVLLFVLFSLLLASCNDSIDSPSGPGDDFVGKTFEFTGDFNQGNDYQLVFDFQQSGFIPYESDVIIAYILWESNAGVDYWRPLPQTVYLSDGSSFNYNYDFAADISSDRILDMSVFLDGFIDFASLPPAYTTNQIFRIVVVPSDFLDAANVSINDIESILNSPKIEMEDLGSKAIK